MRSKRVWARLLGVEHTVIEQVRFDEDAEAIVTLVRPARSRRSRCGLCGRKSPGYDRGEGRRRWRALDLATVQGVSRGRGAAGGLPPPRRGRGCGAWARHGAGFTRAFKDTAVWLAVHSSRVAVAELLGVAWRTVGRMVTRVAEEAGLGGEQQLAAAVQRIALAAPMPEGGLLGPPRT